MTASAWTSLCVCVRKVLVTHRESIHAWWLQRTANYKYYSILFTALPWQRIVCAPHELSHSHHLMLHYCTGSHCSLSLSLRNIFGYHLSAMHTCTRSFLKCGFGICECTYEIPIKLKPKPESIEFEAKEGKTNKTSQSRSQLSSWIGRMNFRLAQFNSVACINEST